MNINRFPFFILFALVAGCASGQPSKIYSTKKYSISYPEKWRLDTSKTVIAATVFFSPLDSAGDRFDDNVNILEQDLRGQNIDLKKYKEISESQLPAMGEGAKMLKSEIQKTPSGERFYFECLMSMYGNHLHTKAYCRIKENIAYLVTLTAAADSFDRYDSLGTPILESFTLK